MELGEILHKYRYILYNIIKMWKFISKFPEGPSLVWRQNRLIGKSKNAIFM